MKTNIKIIIYLLMFVFLTTACNFLVKNGECEGFNFNKIPFNEKYYVKNLTYTNGIDTVRLEPEYYHTSENDLNGYANPICEPSFVIKYTSTKSHFYIFYEFTYGLKAKSKPILFINILNSSFEINIDSNSVNKQINITKVQKNLGSNSNRLIKSICLKEFRIMNFVTQNNVKWRLIQLAPKTPPTKTP